MYALILSKERGLNDHQFELVLIISSLSSFSQTPSSLLGILQLSLKDGQEDIPPPKDMGASATAVPGDPDYRCVYGFNDYNSRICLLLPFCKCQYIFVFADCINGPAVQDFRLLSHCWNQTHKNPMGILGRMPSTYLLDAQALCILIIKPMEKRALAMWLSPSSNA